MAKSPHLVCQHLENIGREALGKYQEIIRGYVRGRHGVYALYRGKRLYYVGLASNLRSRLKTHLRDQHRNLWDRFSVYLTLGDDHLQELEAFILRIAKPAGNKQREKLPRSEDMWRSFKRDVRRRQSDELKTLFGGFGLAEISKPLKKDVVGNEPPLSKYFSKRTPLRVRFKGRLLKAQVRADGKIRFGGKVFNSPAMAGAAACKRPTCNGWKFWRYERAPGEWVLLDTLRRR